MYRIVFLLIIGILTVWFAPKQSLPEAISQVKSANVQKQKVFAAIYERGSRYQKEKTIYQQPTIKEHIEHHEALGDKLIAAGPLKALPEDKTVGIIVFKAESDEAASHWLEKDPAVVGKVLNATVRQWGVSGIREFGQK